MDLPTDLSRRFLDAIEEFLAETGMSARRLSIDVTHDPTFVRRLREGDGCRLSTYEKFVKHMIKVRSELARSRQSRRAA